MGRDSAVVRTAVDGVAAELERSVQRSGVSSNFRIVRINWFEFKMDFESMWYQLVVILNVDPLIGAGGGVREEGGGVRGGGEVGRV